MPQLPTLFVSHGAPDFILGDHPAISALRDIGRRHPTADAIVIISAHWTRYPVGITSGANPDTIHDFSGFGDALYQLHYPARGQPALAETLATQLTRTGLEAQTVADRGLDHGAWVPLMMAYPKADIPVIQISLPSDNLRHCIQLGEALAPLRRQNILIIGSGGSVHNLRAMNREQHTDHWADEFENWLKQTVEEGNTEALADPQQSTPLFTRAHPTVEHYAPLLVARAAAGTRPNGSRLHSSFTWGNIGMAMFEFH